MKNSKRQERGKRSHKRYMRKSKVKISIDNQLSSFSSTNNSTLSKSYSRGNSTPSTFSSIGNCTTSNAYIYDASTVVVLAIGACVIFVYNMISSQASKNNKSRTSRYIKNIEDFIKVGLIITKTTTGIFYALEAANAKAPKASLDGMDVMKLADGACG